MDSLIREISEHYVENLSGREGKLTAEELVALGIPSIIVQQMEYAILNFLENKIISKLSEWADIESDQTQNALKGFLNSIKTELAVSKIDAEEILHDATDLCFRLTVQPRKYIPELLFDDKESVTKNEINECFARLPAHQHLYYALVRYMEKKNRESINREQAEQVINTIDERLIADYNPLNWLDILKPLFVLSGGLIHSEFLRFFFEEKGLSKVALKFERLEDTLTDTEFIEIMSSAELLNFEGYSDSQHSLFEDDEELPELNQETDEVTLEEDGDNKRTKPVSDEAETEEDSSIDVNRDEEMNEADKQDKSENILELFGTLSDDTGYLDVGKLDDDDDEQFADEEIEVSKPAFEDPVYDIDEDDHDWHEDDEFPEDEHGEDREGEKTDEKPVDIDQPSASDKSKIEEENQFFDDEEEGGREVSAEEPWKFTGDDDETEDQPEKNNSTIYDDLNLVQSEQLADQNNDEKQDSFEKESGSDDIYDDNTVEENVKGTDKDSDEIPMWKSFLERDDPDHEPSFFFDESSDIEQDSSGHSEIEEDEINEKQLFNTKSEVSESEDIIEELFDWLLDEKDSFVFEIFEGSEAAYEQALADLMVFDSWKNASKYLEKEIFTKRNIDVYDETAVDFTDRLHAFFMEHK